VDPTVTLFPIVRSVGEPDYTGDLNINIPLLTIPGRGRQNFDIELQYVMGNGVPISESASWVGLGWNLNMYEITCEPVWKLQPPPPNGDRIPHHFYKYSSEYLSDFFYLNYHRGSISFWLKSVMTDGIRDGVPQKWSAIKIQAFKEASSEEFKYFVVTGLSETKHVFANRLSKESRNSFWNHSNSTYYYVFKLTAILSPDYVDGGGDPYTISDENTLK
jgi:hypothetical protein